MASARPALASASCTATSSDGSCQINIDGLFEGDFSNQVDPTLRNWENNSNDTPPPTQFLIDAFTDLTFGTTPFNCPTSAPADCGAQKAYSTYVLNFLPDTASQPGFGIHHTLEFTAPAGTVFPNNTYDYQVGASCNNPEDNGNAAPVPLPGDFVDCQEGAFPVEAISHPNGAPNAIDVTLPYPLSNSSNSTLFIAHVVNPPEGTYSNLEYPVTTTDQPVPGYPPSGGNQTFGHDQPFQDNSTLDASTDRTQVGPTNLVRVTATIRDQYGNGVNNQSVIIEPLQGAPTQSQTQTQTQDDGTVTDAFYDDTAETVTLQAQERTANFVVPGTATITFTPGPPDPNHSFATVTPCGSTCPPANASALADGSPDAQVTLDLADQFGNPTIQPANPDTGAPQSGDQIVLQPQLRGTAFPFLQGTITPVDNTGGDDSKCPTQPLVAGAGCTNDLKTQTINGTIHRWAEAQFLISDPTAEQVTFDPEDLTMGEILSASSLTPTINFYPGVPVAANSTIAGPTKSVPADGTTSGRILVTLRDADGNPVPGVGVSLVQSSGGHAKVAAAELPNATSGCPAATQAAAGTTDCNGHAAFDITDTTIESPSFDATYSGTVNGTAVSGTVPTSGAGPTVNFVAGGTSASLSTVVASTTSALANGIAAPTITVTLLDGQGNVAAGRRVTLTQSSGGQSSITPAAATTDANGVAKFTVTDSTVESVTYTATDTTTGVTLNQRPSVAFTETPSGTKTSLTPVPTSVPADGTTSSTITVILRSGDSLPVPGKQLCLTQALGSVPSNGPCPAAGSGPSTVTPLQVDAGSSGCPTQAPAGTTDCKGIAKFTVTATTAESVSYGVIDLTDYPSGPALGSHTAVSFTTPTTEAGASVVSANPTRVLADTAGPDGTSVITVTLIAGNGSVLTNRTVQLGASRPTSTVSAIQIPTSTSGCASQAAGGVTDCNGQAQFAVSDTAVGTTTYSATDESSSPPVSLKQTATVTYIPNEAVVSTVKADSPSATADGGATAQGVDDITVTLDPAEPLTGNGVSLTQSAGAASTVTPVQIPDSTSGCSTQAAAGTSDCNGQARFQVTDKTIESVTYTARDTSTGVTLSQQATVSFIPPAPVIAGLSPNAGPVAGGTRVTISGSALFVEGTLPSVTFGGKAATNVSCSASSSCTVTAPGASAAGVVAVVVTTPGGSSTAASPGANSFEYLAAAPTVTKISPKSGPKAGGTTVTVTGTNFATLSTTTVQFGTAVVKPSSINAAGTQLTVVSPAETGGTVYVTVTTPAGTSKKVYAARFTYGGLL